MAAAAGATLGAAILLLLASSETTVPSLYARQLKDSLGEAHASSPPPPDPFSSPVYAEGRRPGATEGQKTELLRFVTAYGTGLEAVVDATPYSPLLRAAVADALARGRDGNLTFFAFIDTWVSNGTGRDVLYMNNVTGQCSRMRKSYGNGWLLSLDLLLAPRAAALPDVRPRALVTLASGYYGARQVLGDISIVEGTVLEGAEGSNATVLLDTGADFEAAPGNPPVYGCSGGPGDLEMPSLLGYAAQQASFLVAKYGSESNESKRLANDLFEVIAYPDLVKVQVTSIDNFTNTVAASFDPAKVQPEVGMPVYYKRTDVYTDTRLSTMWLNLTYPFNASGRVVDVQNGSMVVELMHPCLPRGDNFALPGLLIPKNSTALPDAHALVSSVFQWGLADSARKKSVMPDSSSREDAAWPEPLLLRQEAQRLTPWPLLGRLDVSALRPPVPSFGSDRSSTAFSLLRTPTSHGSNGTRSCVVRRNRHGRLITRHFSLPRLGLGERVLLQLTVTGHGWAMTSEQCGEYCHAVYRLSFNGRTAANVTQFRDDCHLNPINGSVQRGTWDEHRNGWCPGTVEPGLFVDVTNWVQSGENHMGFDVVVWSSRTGRYEPYTDYAGFAFGDQASLVVGLSLFVYDTETVKAVLALKRAYSAAETALREGSSLPKALRPESLASPLESSLHALSSEEEEGQGQQAHAQRHRRHGRLGRRRMAVSLGEDPRPSGVAPGAPRGAGLLRRKASMAANSSFAHGDTTSHGGAFNFEARAPWYLYSQSSDGFPGAEHGAVTLPIFEGALIQGSSRTVYANISSAALSSVDWDQAALYLRLTKPPDPLQFDHWDRVGSVGLVMDGHHVIAV